MPRTPGAKRDKDVACLETLKKKLRYTKGKTGREFLREFTESLEVFRREKRKNNADWANFNDWGSPDHQAQLEKVTEEYLAKNRNAERFWPTDETDPFHNGLAWQGNEKFIRSHVKKLLYRKVHPLPEEPKRQTKKAGKQPAPVRRSLQAVNTRSQGATRNTGIPLISPETPPGRSPTASASNLSASGSSSRAPHLGNTTTTPTAPSDLEIGRPTAMASGEYATTYNQETTRRKSSQPSIRPPLRPVAFDTDGANTRDWPLQSPTPTVTAPSQSPAPVPRGVSARPRAPDAVMEEPVAQVLQPSVEGSGDGEPASKAPSSAVQFTYLVIHHRSPFVGEAWNPQGEFSTKSLAELKAELPFEFESGPKNLHFVLKKHDYRMSYTLDHTSEAEFEKLKRLFRDEMKRCVGGNQDTRGPLHFQIDIELVGGARCSKSVIRQVRDLDFPW